VEWIHGGGVEGCCIDQVLEFTNTRQVSAKVPIQRNAAIVQIYSFSAAE
jgi:hypothetical protein